MGPITQHINGYCHHRSYYDYLGPLLGYRSKPNVPLALQNHTIPLNFAHLHPKHICSQGVPAERKNFQSVKDTQIMLDLMYLLQAATYSTRHLLMSCCVQWWQLCRLS